MKILFISSHAFLPSTRKTSVHFVSQALADRGHAVSTVSVGFSTLTYLKDRSLYRSLASAQKNRFVEQSPGYRSACYMPLFHPFSTQNPTLNRATGWFFRLYGQVLPHFLKEELRSADAVFLEGGTSLCLFDAIRRCKPEILLIYFRRDHLDSIGASSYLTEVEQRIAPLFDHVCVPSPCMARRLPARSKVTYLPQGIEKRAFDLCRTSPYPRNSRNAVVVGNMLFDKDAVIAMAASAPDVCFHLFGSGICGPFPGNVKVYGERPFGETVPFIKFADFGIAPYKMSKRERYLVQSSLKLIQYSYCLLPIVAPDLLSGSRANLIVYRQDGEDDWATVIGRALEAKRSTAWNKGILSWTDVAMRVEEQLTALRTPQACGDGFTERLESPGLLAFAPAGLRDPLRISSTTT